MPTTVTRWTPYPARASLFNARNARAAYNAGRKAASFIKKNLPKRQAPVTVKHVNKKVKTSSGKYKKVHKDTITSKHARKAIANVVRKELNKEIETNKTLNHEIWGTYAHRVWWVYEPVMDVNNARPIEGEKVHIKGIRFKGTISENVTAGMRGTPQSLEFYAIWKKGPIIHETIAKTNSSGLWFNATDSQFVKADTNAAAGDYEDRRADISPRKNGFTILSQRTIRPQFNMVPGSTAPRRKWVEFYLKVEKDVELPASMETGEAGEAPRLYIAIRGMGYRGAPYASADVAEADLQWNVLFRDT